MKVFDWLVDKMKAIKLKTIKVVSRDGNYEVRAEIETKNGLDESIIHSWPVLEGEDVWEVLNDLIKSVISEAKFLS